MFKRFFERVSPRNKEEKQIKETFEQVSNLLEESLKRLEEED